MFKKSIMIFLITMVLVIILQNKYSFAADSNEVNLTKTPDNASQLNATRITPVLDTKINTGENLIYCSTFQMAWNSLCQDILKGETAEIENAPDYVKTLNNLINELANVSDDSYVAMGGLSQDNIVERFNKALLEKFKDVDTKELPIIKDKFGHDQILIFAYLNKLMPFEHEFQKTKPILFQSNKESWVKSFGLDYYNSRNESHENILKQLDIVYYFDYGEFSKSVKDNNIDTITLFKNGLNPKTGLIIKLKTKSEDDLVISTLSPLNTFLDTFFDIDNRINNPSTYRYLNDSIPLEIKNNITNNFFNIKTLKPDESIRIPNIKIKIDHFYSELEKKSFLNKQLLKNNYYIEKAFQDVKFLLNEKGVILSSSVRILMKMGRSDEHKIYLVDKPFVIYLRSKNSNYPYFMAYIQNPYLLVMPNNNEDIF